MTELNDGKPRRIRNCKACMQLVQKLFDLPPTAPVATAVFTHVANHCYASARTRGGLTLWHGEYTALMLLLCLHLTLVVLPLLVVAFWYF